MFLDPGRKAALLAALLATLWKGLPAHGQALPAPLAMPEAIATALENNPDVLEARSKLEEARARVSEARSAYYPTIRLTSQAGQTNNFTSLLGAGGAATGSDLATLLGSTQTVFLATRLGVSYTLWDWGRAGSACALADLDERIAHEELRQARQSVALMVREAYLGLASARSAARIASESAARAAVRLEATRKAMQRGVETELMVLQVQARTKGLEQEARRAARAERKAEAALALLLGGRSDQAIALAPMNGGGLGRLPALDEARRQALEARPDYRIAQARAQQEQIRLDAEGKANWPAVGLSASGGYVTSGAFRGASSAVGSQPDVSVLGSVSWNLFDGFRSDGALRRARLAADRQRQACERLARLIAAEVENERAAVLDAAEREQQVELELGVAERALEMARSRHRKGIATSLDLLDAELALMQARQRHEQAAFDRSLAEARLARALGEDPPGFPFPPPPESAPAGHIAP